MSEPQPLGEILAGQVNVHLSLEQWMLLLGWSSAWDQPAQVSDSLDLIRGQLDDAPRGDMMRLTPREVTQLELALDTAGDLNQERS